MILPVLIIFIMIGVFTALIATDRGRPMAVSIQLRKPVYNIAGLLLPFVTFGVWLLVGYVSDTSGFKGFGFAILLAVLFGISIIISFLLSILSLHRRERFQVLTYLELVIYGILSFVVLAAFLQ